jgi:trimeric autotransporter adhesin
MAAVGTLTIEMAANVARLAQDMQKATKTVDGAMSKIQRSVDVARTAIVGLAGVLTIRQFSSFIKSSAAASEQLERMAFLANTSVASFQRMSLASDRFGISQEKLGDILKDTQDKVGDFMQTGGGAMADFFENIAPKVGVTAEQFRKLNGRDALQLYVSSLEKANLSQSDMVFYMEAIASDSTLLLPLLRENGKAFQEIAIQAEKFGAVMDDRTIAASKDLNANLHSMNNFMDGIGISIYSALLPGLNAISDSFIKFAESSRIAQYAASAVLIIFQTLTVVGSDLIFVIDQVVKGLVALVQAQYKLLSGNFSGAIKVFEEYNAQARDARTALDELQAEIMGLGKESDNAEKSVNGLSGSLGSGVKAATDLENAYDALVKTLRSDITKSTAELQAEQQGLNNAQTDFLELVSGNDWKQYTAAQKMLITDLYKQRIETEKLIDAEKARAKAAEERLKKMLADEKEFMDEIEKENKKNEEDRIKAQEKLYEEHRREIEKIGDQLTDALMRAFESGKGFGQAFKDTLVNMFKTMVLRPVLAPIAGAFAGAFGGGAAMAAGGGGGALSALSGAGSLAQLAAGASSLGVGIAAGFSNALSLNFAGSLTAAGQLIGTGAMSGITAGIGMAAGTLLPIVGAIALIPSIGRALFGGGRRTTGTGIAGTFTTGGANVVGFEDWARSGGLFRRSSSGTNYSAIGGETQMFLDQSLLAITQATRSYAGLLGLNANAIDDVTQQVRINLMGLSAEQQQQAIANALNSFADELAKQYLGTFQEVTTRDVFGREKITVEWIAGPFVRTGETAGEALGRLASSLSVANQAFDTLNVAVYEGSLAAANMASQLMDIFGGTEQFITQTSFYYSEFYSEAERAATTTRQLTTIMGELGFALPKTREQFRLLVESQDLTTHSGREMYAMLLGLAPTFAEISDSVEDLYQQAQDATNVALQVLERSIAAQQEALRVSERLARQNVDAIESVFQVLNSSIRGLTGGGFTAATGQAFISQTLQTARGMGPLPNPEELQSAISAVTSGLSPSAFRSEFEFRRAQSAFVAQLTELRGYTENQLSTAEQQLVAITEQITKLDEQLELARIQVNELRGINASVLTVADAIYQLEASMAAERAALQSRQSAASSSSSSASQTMVVTKKQKDAETLVRDLFAAHGANVERDRSTFDLWVAWAERMGNQRTIEHWTERGNRGTTTATFAAGGLHTGGMRIVGERGPELEMTGPARYMSNATLASMMGNGNGEEIRQLREENKVQMRALVSLQNRMTKLLERWDGDGLPEERAVA